MIDDNTGKQISDLSAKLIAQLITAAAELGRKGADGTGKFQRAKDALTRHVAHLEELAVRK